MSPSKAKRKPKLSLASKSCSKRFKCSDDENSNLPGESINSTSPRVPVPEPVASTSKPIQSAVFLRSPSAAIHPPRIDFYYLQPTNRAAVNRPNVNVFASAERLERAQSSQHIPVPSRLPPAATGCSASTAGFVVLADHFGDADFHTQLPDISVTQMDRLCETAYATSQRESPGTEERVHQAHSPSASPPETLRRPPTPTPTTLREAILQDFDCWSPSLRPPPQMPSPVCSPTPEFKAANCEQLRTYSRRRQATQRQQAANRCLSFGGSGSCASTSSEERLGILSESDDSVGDAMFDTCQEETPRRAAVSAASPEIDLNRSGTVRENILELSQYFSQQSPLPDKPKPTEIDGQVRIEADVDALFKQILWQKRSDRRPEDWSSGESRSFAGFGESITLQEDFGALESRFSVSDGEDEVAECEVEMEGEEDLKNLLLADDDDLFAKLQSPEKVAQVAMELEECVRNVTSVGFSTGRGATIPVSTDALRHSTRMFKDDGLTVAESGASKYNVESAIAKPTIDNHSPTSVGFSTGRGVKIAVSSDALKRSSILFHEDMELESESSIQAPNIEPSCNNDTSTSSQKVNANILMQCEAPSSKLFDDDVEYKHISAMNTSNHKPSNGFSTARGDTIAVSKEALKLSSKLFEDDMEIGNSSAMETPSNKPSSGFSTARGATIAVTKDALKLSSKLFEEDMEIGHSSAMETHSNKSTSGFSTARGAPIAMSKDALKLSSKLFEEDMEIGHSSAMKTPSSKSTSGFSTARGATIAVSKDAQRLSIKLFEDDVDLADANAMETPNNKPSIGFSTARGATIAVSKDSLQQSSKIFADDMEIQLEDAMQNTISAPTNQGFRTGRGSAISISADALQRSSKLFEAEAAEPANAGDSMQTPKNKPSWPNRTSTPINNAFASAGGSSIDFHASRTPTNQKTLPSTTDTAFKTPSNPRPMSMTQEISASTRALLEDEMSAHEDCDAALFSCGPVAEPLRKSLSSTARPTRLASRFDEEAGAHPNQPDPPLLVASHILEARHSAHQAQQQRIASKTGAKIKPGALYVRKLIAERSKWPQFVQNQQPFAGQSAQPRTPTIPFDSAAEFTFEMPASLATNTAGLQLPDDMCVHLDPSNRVGLPQLLSAFLASSAVDPRLLPDGWFRHHYALIVHKLAAMERSFPGHFGGGRALCVQNVALQLKLRYDVQIDRAQRSVLHRICELDAAASGRMVLFVLAEGAAAGECRLSDGHYVMRALLDEELQRLWRSGRIAVGTKLMVHGAELCGLAEGCSPLELPPTAALRLSANSTRRVRWFERLGACRVALGFRVRLQSVLPNGGRIGCLRLRIVRVYGVLYVDKTRRETAGTVLRSERVQKRHETSLATTATTSTQQIEKLVSQITREIHTEQMGASTRKSARLSSAAAISDSTDISQVYAMLRTSNDPEAVEADLGATQKRDLLAYQSRQNEIRNDLIAARVQQRLAAANNNNDHFAGRSAKITRLLKVRVIDAGDRSGCLRTAMLSIWNPHELLFDVLREEGAIELAGASASGMRCNDLQLSAGRSAQFKRLPTPAEPMSPALQRCLTPIASIHRSPSFQPAFQEFDTVGLVVHITDPSDRKFQSVYLAAPADNGDDQEGTLPPLLLCINFWAGLSAFAYDDLVRVGQPLAARDLQWRTISTHSRIPCAFATEFTQLTERPRQVHLLGAIAELRERLQAVEIEQFVQRCCRIVEKSKSMSARKTNTSNADSSGPAQPLTPMKGANDSAGLVGSRSTTPKVQRRIDRLAMYGEPPPLSPIPLQMGAKRSGLCRK